MTWNFQIIRQENLYFTFGNDVPCDGFVAPSTPATGARISVGARANLSVRGVDFSRSGDTLCVHFQSHVTWDGVSGAKWKVL